jgi:2,3-bisphosphoglycerate-independent phosphoglycerate mutase
MNGILILLSGASDRPIPQLDNRTPLQYAYKRNINDLASKGINGMLYPISIGVKPGEASSVFSILGYDVEKEYPGLSPIVNAGLGTNLSPGDLALRGTFATVDENGNVISDDAGLDEGGKVLALSLDGMDINGIRISVTSFDEVTSSAKNIGTSACGVVLHGKGLSNKIVPVENGKGLPHFKSINGSEEAKTTAQILNEFIENSRKMLEGNEINTRRKLRKKMPANSVVLGEPKVVPEIKRFNDKYNVKGACVAGNYLVKGVSRICGMDVINVEGATGGKNTNLIAKMEAVLEVLMNYHFVLLHIKMPDIYGMEKDARGKIDAIERIDTALGYLLQEAENDTVIGVTSDYTRSTITGERTGDASPLLFFSPGTRRDEVREFDELSCVNGHVGRISGKGVMPFILNQMDMPMEIND